MTLLVNNTALRSAFRSGDKAALTVVYREYAGSLFAMLLKGFPVESQNKRYVFRGYKEPWQLENAVQEIFTRAFTEKARCAYDGLRPYKNYLMTIARNYVVDAFRRQRKERSLFDDLPEHRFSELTDEAKEAPLNPESVLVNQKLKEETAKFVDALEVDERALFEIRFVRALSVEAAAAALGMSEYRLKQGERRIRKRFFVYMRARGFFEGFEYVPPVTAILVILYATAASGERFCG